MAIRIIEITIEEFKDEIYSKYIKLFPSIERREWKAIEKTYKSGIEKFYKILDNNTNVGFFMVEKINDSYPVYLDYFGIFKKYQNKGYGSKALKQLIDFFTSDNGVCGEIEKIDKDNLLTVKRFEFYQKLGFEKIDSEYLLYDVLYVPLVYSNKKYLKEEIDKILFKYYEINCGIENLKKYCKIIK